MSRTIKKWDNAANAYMETQENSEYANINKKVVSERFVNLCGKRVLDLGCGYGWYTDYFASIGAEIIGCDGSNKMIDIAMNRYPLCKFECLNIENTLPYENNFFDMVFCNQVLMDVENVDDILEEILRVLRTGGILYFSIVHPAFYDGKWKKKISGFKYGKIVSKYLSEYHFDNDFWGKTTHFHRPISKYINTAIEKGFQLVHIEEPISYDGINKTKELPLFLFAEFKKV